MALRSAEIARALTHAALHAPDPAPSPRMRFCVRCAAKLGELCPRELCTECWYVLATKAVRAGSTKPPFKRACALPGCTNTCEGSPLVFFCSHHATRHRRPGA
jgi:hypothetical protein